MPWWYITAFYTLYDTDDGSILFLKSMLCCSSVRILAFILSVLLPSNFQILPWRWWPDCGKSWFCDHVTAYLIRLLGSPLPAIVIPIGAWNIDCDDAIRYTAYDSGASSWWLFFCYAILRCGAILRLETVWHTTIPYNHAACQYDDTGNRYMWCFWLRKAISFTFIASVMMINFTFIYMILFRVPELCDRLPLSSDVPCLLYWKQWYIQV